MLSNPEERKSFSVGSFVIIPFLAKSKRQWKLKERIRLIKILLQQSWSRRYCIPSVQHQCIFLAKNHSIGIASLHSNVLSQSLVPMNQLREMAFSQFSSQQRCHLGLQTRSLTLGNNLPIIFWHLRYIRTNGFYKSKICWTPNIEPARALCMKQDDSFSSLIRIFFHSFNRVGAEKLCCVTVS